MDSVLRTDSTEEENRRDSTQREEKANPETGQSEDVLSNNGFNEDAKFDSVEL